MLGLTDVLCSTRRQKAQLVIKIARPVSKGRVRQTAHKNTRAWCAHTDKIKDTQDLSTQYTDSRVNMWQLFIAKILFIFI
jgi:hypothetical protein